MTDQYYPHVAFGERWPNETYFTKLDPCPECGAEYNLDGIRRGPAILLFTEDDYRVVCLACFKSRGRTGKNEIKAVTNWNNGAQLGRLRSIRMKSGLTQEQLAGLAGVTVGTVSRLERGVNVKRPDARQRLAEVLCVGVEAI